jgi:4-hydroxy-tetrahydrodipicolinate reductase
MHILILGGTGKLGKIICEQMIERHIPFTLVTREHLAQQDSLQALFQHLSAPFVCLDVSLAEPIQTLCQHLVALHGKDPQNSVFSKMRGLVVGSTGHSAACKELFLKVAHMVPVCIASNFSKGIFLFEEILSAQTHLGIPVHELARKLGFELALHETHHKLKKDAPSGTALSLAQKACIGEQHVSAARVGYVIGEHTVMVSGQGEQLSLTHQSHHRGLYAQGALDLCKNIYARAPAPGILDKKDYLI